MPRGPAITEIKRGQSLARHSEYISFGKIADMVNRSFGAVQGAVRQGFKYKAPKQWKGKCKVSETQKRAMIRMFLQRENSARTI